MRKTLTGLCVALETEHDFGSAIPSGSDIFRHVPSIFFRIHRETSGQTKIAYLELAIGIDQKIAWLEVSMQHIGGVNVLQPT